MLEILGLHAIAAVSYGLFLVMLLKLTRPAYLTFRRRKSGFGVVFNSVTGKPEAMSAVSLQTLGGKTFRTVATDSDGRYNLVAPKGDYILEVRKKGFSFPSKVLNKKNNDTAYDKLLTAKHIIVTDHGSITMNIPIDPVTELRQASLFKRNVLRGRWIQDMISMGAPISAVAVAFLLADFWIVWIFLILYVSAIVFRFLDFKPPQPPFGTVRDADTNQPLDKVMVRIFERKFGKLLEAQVTSSKGRYAFVVKPGPYRLLVQKQGYKSVIINFPDVKTENFLLAKDVKMQRREI